MPLPNLMIGAGRSRVKRIDVDGVDEWVGGLVTLDNNPDHGTDVVHDLNVHPLPFEDNSFSTIHAYEVLEHLGSLGDYRFFFSEFSEYWRILEPGGLFYATVPALDSPWLFGDPSHTRVIVPESLVFLSQAEYERQVGVTAMSDFRSIYKADFEPVGTNVEGGSFKFVLRAIKSG